MRVFKVPQISMRMHLMERSTQTVQENGMVCYVLTNISRDMSEFIYLIRLRHPKQYPLC